MRLGDISAVKYPSDGGVMICSLIEDALDCSGEEGVYVSTISDGSNDSVSGFPH